MGAMIGPRLHIELVDDGKNQADQQGCTNDLVKKSRPETGDRWKGRENSGRVIQVGIYQNPFRVVSHKEQERRDKRPGELGHDVMQHFGPGESFGGSQGDRDCRVEMRTTDRPGDVDTKGDGQAPAKNDVGVAAFDDFSRNRRIAAEKNDHCDRTATEQDQNHGSEKFS